MPRSADLWQDTYRPLRIVAHLASPVAVLPHEGFLPLDAVLEYAAYQWSERAVSHARLQRPSNRFYSNGWPVVLQYGPAHHPGPIGPNNEPANYCLPIKRHGHKFDPDWFWAASWARAGQPCYHDRQHWNKRFDGLDPELGRHLDFGGRRGSITVATGRYKSYHQPLALLVTPTLTWHVLGAADGLRVLLAEIIHLGHKRSQGYGEVLRWEIWPADRDLSCLDEHGRPARALPAWWLAEQGVPEEGLYWRPAALRAPSWHPSRRRRCAVPEMENGN